MITSCYQRVEKSKRVSYWKQTDFQKWNATEKTRRRMKSMCFGFSNIKVNGWKNEIGGGYISYYTGMNEQKVRRYKLWAKELFQHTWQWKKEDCCKDKWDHGGILDYLPYDERDLDVWKWKHSKNWMFKIQEKENKW